MAGRVFSCGIVSNNMHPRVTLYVANFFFSIFSTLIIYILLPYLSTVMPATYTGLAIAAGGLLAMLVFPSLPALVERYGAQELSLASAIALMIALFALATAPGAVTGIFLVAVTIAVQPFISYSLDLLLEATGTESGAVGRVRSLFLTAWNVGVFAAPLLIGALLDSTNDYARGFLAAAAVLAPFIILFAVRKLPKGEPPQLSHFKETLARIGNNRDLFAVTFCHQVLWFFYVWAPFYVPVYLHTVLGMPWSDLSWIFAIMLIPYALVEYPAGWIADRYLGDKEMMFVGFLIAGGSLAALSLVTSVSTPILVLVILLLTRTGAALVESTTEGHFFRRVSARDVNSMSIFRASWPIAYFVGPILASFVLSFGTYAYFFLFAGGFVAIAGAGATLFIRDFR